MVRLRRFRADDMPGMLAVHNASAAGGVGQGPTTREGLAAYWQSSGVRAERDLWVVAGREELLAYGGLRPWHSIGWLQVELVVHPAWRGQGLGQALLRRLVADARRRGASDLCAVAPDEPATGGRFLRRHGFQPSVARQHMRLQPVAAAEVTVPGFQLRTAGSDDCAALSEINNGAYATGERVGRADEAGYRRFLAESGARVWAAAELPAGRLVGLCEVREAEAVLDGAAVTTGHIGSLAVLPAYQRRGLGRSLLARGIGLCREAGWPSVELNSDRDNAPALHLYERLGFQPVYAFTVYRLALA